MFRVVAILVDQGQFVGQTRFSEVNAWDELFWFTDNGINAHLEFEDEPNVWRQW